MPPDGPSTRDQTQSSMSQEAGESPASNGAIVAFALLHFVCCGLPLLLLSGVSLAFLAPYWPVAAGILAVLGGIGFVWYLRRGCATCPRNEGRAPLRVPP
ncbi:MAG TPA: hypothetical protein VLA19_22435 [Herpetosiphonaceae bacterium]|nr:hypothetical protein [Herpetosiphonaceae bacterium]